MQLIIRLLTLPFKVLFFPFKLLPKALELKDDPYLSTARTSAINRNMKR